MTFRLVWILALAGFTRPVAAQDLPGGRAVDVDLHRAQFNALMIKTVREFNTAWQNAWPVSSSTNRIAEYYSSEATLLPPGGGLVSGQTAVRRATDSLRAHVREVTLALVDYEASEGFAYYYGSFELQPRLPTAAMITGQHFTVLKRESKGFRIRSQLLMAEETGSTLPQIDAAHPSGPLTVTAMANKGTLERYRSANQLVNRLHLAWSRSDTTALFGLFQNDALIQLPGQTTGGKLNQIQTRRDLIDYLARSGELHMVTLDFDGAGRMAVAVGRYYLELDGGASIEGYFAMVITGYRDDWEIRSLILS
jgi:ketosteroid isomerase-like protein